MRNIGAAFLLMLSLCVGAFEAAFAQTDRLYVSEQSPVLKLIRDADETIDIEIYTLKDLKVVAALKRAMKRGVRVRILQTPNPIDSCKVFEPKNGNELCDKLRNFVTYVRENGGRYVPFDNELCGTPGSNCFQHGKMMIVDSKRALVSTGNFDASNLCDLSQNPTACNRDYTLTTEDPAVVRTLHRLFWRDLVGKPYDVQAILAEQPVARITASPYSMRPLLKFIRSARVSIQIENQYLKDPEMNEALIQAAERGVKVFVMVSSFCSFGPPRDGDVERWTEIFSAFDRANIRTRMFTRAMSVGGMPGYLHAKVILVDGERAWVGSVNGSTQSITENREYGIFSDDPEVVAQLGEVLREDFTDKNSETWRQSLKCKKDPLPKPKGNKAR